VNVLPAILTMFAGSCPYAAANNPIAIINPTVRFTCLSFLYNAASSDTTAL
jgi:hypothetical protein